MNCNECTNQNDLITPITPSSSDFENSSTINPDSSNPEDPVICIQQTQKKSIYKEIVFYIFYSHFSFFCYISIYYLYINFIFI